MTTLEEQYERETRSRVESQLAESDRMPRELLPHGAWAPIKGIYDVGWKEWESLPHADFVRDLRQWDEDYLRDHSSEPWSHDFVPMIERQELTLEQLRFFSQQQYLRLEGFVENLARALLANVHQRDIRDLVARHLSEETGHSTLYEDFCVEALGMNRVKDLWEGKPLGDRDRRGTLSKFWLQHITGDDCSTMIMKYAIIPLWERHLPRRNSALSKVYRTKYGFPATSLTFVDLHTYIDIYHERIGLYVLGKFADTKEKQELARNLFVARRELQETDNEAIWHAMAHKK
jgi:pyrroloquinoline quinone (PQQ) biosynthesis protein C